MEKSLRRAFVMRRHKRENESSADKDEDGCATTGRLLDKSSLCTSAPQCRGATSSLPARSPSDPGAQMFWPPFCSSLGFPFIYLLSDNVTFAPELKYDVSRDVRCDKTSASKRWMSCACTFLSAKNIHGSASFTTVSVRANKYMYLYINNNLEFIKFHNHWFCHTILISVLFILNSAILNEFSTDLSVLKSSENKIGD